jgi:hypothetical protein
MAGTIVGLNRYPVKSMLGEAPSEVDVTTRGVLGDRAYAVLDQSTGKVASAKNPAKWGRLLEVRAGYVDAVSAGQELPPVQLTFPDGTTARSDDSSIDETLTSYLGRDVTLASTGPEGPIFEEVWPADVEGLAPEEFISSTSTTTTAEGDAISDLSLGMAAPPGTFFDLATLHLLTTSTRRSARQGPGQTSTCAATDRTSSSRRPRRGSWRTPGSLRSSRWARPPRRGSIYRPCAV